MKKSISLIIAAAMVAAASGHAAMTPSQERVAIDTADRVKESLSQDMTIIKASAEKIPEIENKVNWIYNLLRELYITSPSAAYIEVGTDRGNLTKILQSQLLERTEAGEFQGKTPGQIAAAIIPSGTTVLRFFNWTGTELDLTAQLEPLEELYLEGETNLLKLWDSEDKAWESIKAKTQGTTEMDDGNMEEIYKSEGCLTRLHLPKTVKKVPDELCSRNQRLTHFAAPGATVFGSACLKECKNLRWVDATEAITLEDNAIYTDWMDTSRVYAMEEIVGSKIQKVAVMALAGTIGPATKISLNSLQHTGYYALGNCKLSSNLELPMLQVLGEQAFQDAELHVATFPSLIEIGPSAFSGAAHSSPSIKAESLEIIAQAALSDFTSGAINIAANGLARISPCYQSNSNITTTKPEEQIIRLHSATASTITLNGTPNWTGTTIPQITEQFKYFYKDELYDPNADELIITGPWNRGGSSKSLRGPANLHIKMSVAPEVSNPSININPKAGQIVKLEGILSGVKIDLELYSKPAEIKIGFTTNNKQTFKSDAAGTSLKLAQAEIDSKNNTTGYNTSSKLWFNKTWASVTAYTPEIPGG